MRTEQYISPSVLVDDLVGFSRLDWSEVWAGPPLPTESHFDEWCELRGWKPLTYEFDLKIQTFRGSEWKLSANGSWRPIVSVRKEVWTASSLPPEPGSRVVETGMEAWSACKNTISGHFDEPAWQGGAGSKEFPPPPGADYWSRPESEIGNPFRMAIWEMESYPVPVLLVLKLAMSPFAWEVDNGGKATVRISIHPQAKVR